MSEIRKNMILYPRQCSATAYFNAIRRSVLLNEKDKAASTAHERVVRSELVAVTFLFAFSLSSLDAHLFVVLLQSSEIFTRL